MRANPAVLVVLAFLAFAPAGVLPVGGAVETYVVLREWESGWFVAGAPYPVAEPMLNAVRLDFSVDACPRMVLLDLLYEPDAARADVPEVATLGVRYEVRAQLFRGEVPVGPVATIRASGYGHPAGVTVGEGEHTLRVHLALGANVAWEARVRGRAMMDHVDCLDAPRLNEVEANPSGTDAGFEWVELVNPNPVDYDVSGWIVRGTAGVPSAFALPNGTTIGAGGFLVVRLADGQALDNVDESVELVDALGRVRDATPALTDRENDARTWQRIPDGADDWAFRTGTPDQANALS